MDSYSKTLELIAEERGHEDILNAITEERMRRFAENRVRGAQDIGQRIEALEKEVKAGRDILEKRLELKRSLEAKFGDLERLEEEIMELKANIIGNKWKTLLA